MKPRDAEAARLETDYLKRVRAALAGRDASEIDEIIQSLKEHIEEELSEALDGEVGLTQMANVLEHLGPPEAYGQAEQSEEPQEKPRTSKLAIAAALTTPAGLVAAALIAAIRIGVLGAAEPGAGTILLLIASMIAGVVISICALAEIRNSHGKLRGHGLAKLGMAIPLGLVALQCVLIILKLISC